MRQFSGKSFLLILLLCLLAFPALAQQKYWVLFQDKGELSLYRPGDLLSEFALANRAKQGIALDQHDYPVNPAYRAGLEALGLKTVHNSRWFNAVSVWMEAKDMGRVLNLPYVQAVQPVGGYQHITGVEDDCEALAPIDTFTRQLTMLGLDALHEQGITGRGVRVAVFDNGFRGAATLAAFSHIFSENRVIASRDFVEPGHNVFDPCDGSCRHGTNVWSILAGDMPGQLRGAAPGADFILLRTEADNSETTQEEDNWVAAAEYADSLGAQVFTTSLGYLTFDGGIGNYSLSDLDGNTAIITRAGDMAASRGILVINSGGNNGDRGLNAPADGDSILAIGSVNPCEAYSRFSSQGPTADGRIKPDLTAMGEMTFYANGSGGVSRGNGTSYSAPLVAGLAACLFQAHPGVSAREVHEALIRSGDRYASPDNFYGYGIPKGPIASGLLRDISLQEGAAGLVYPNPGTGSFFIVLRERDSEAPIRIELFDLAGRRVHREEFAPGPLASLRFSIETHLPTGLYLLQVSDRRSGKRVFKGKISIHNPE